MVFLGAVGELGPQSRRGTGTAAAGGCESTKLGPCERAETGGDPGHVLPRAWAWCWHELGCAGKDWELGSSQRERVCVEEETEEESGPLSPRGRTERRRVGPSPLVPREELL